LSQGTRVFLELLLQDPFVLILHAFLVLKEPQVVSLQGGVLVLQCFQVSQQLCLALEYCDVFSQEAGVILTESDELLAHIHQIATQVSHLLAKARIVLLSAVRDLQKLGSLQHTAGSVVAAALRGEKHQCCGEEGDGSCQSLHHILLTLLPCQGTGLLR